MLTFSTLNSDLRDKQSEFWKSDFIFLILASSGSHTCLQFQVSFNIKEVRISTQKMMLATSH